MESWISPVLLGLGLTLGAAILYHLRQRRSARLRLRLLAGQSHLLSAQLAQRLEELERLDQSALAQLQEETSGILDDLHILLIERQAHLQNCEDLIHLQKQKVAWLATAPKPSPQRAAKGRRETRPQATAPAPLPPPRRDQLEDHLLRQIDDLNKKRRNPPPPPQK